MSSFDIKEDSFETEVEQKIIMEILEFDNYIVNSFLLKKPSLICNQLYRPCKAYNSFYSSFSLKYEQDIDIKNNRLELTLRVYLTIEKGLSLLGIKISDKM